jgi:hypothetical protein
LNIKLIFPKHLVERHCPICVAATACTGLCRNELEVFQDVLGPEVRIERTEHIVAGASRCAYRVSSGASHTVPGHPQAKEKLSPVPHVGMERKGTAPEAHSHPGA